MIVGMRYMEGLWCKCSLSVGFHRISWLSIFCFNSSCKNLYWIFLQRTWEWNNFSLLIFFINEFILFFIILKIRPSVFHPFTWSFFFIFILILITYRRKFPSNFLKSFILRIDLFTFKWWQHEITLIMRLPTTPMIQEV